MYETVPTLFKREASMKEWHKINYIKDKPIKLDSTMFLEFNDTIRSTVYNVY